MEHCSMRFNSVGVQTMPRAECILERKSRFWQIETTQPPIPKSEVICPQPRHASWIPCFIETLNRASPKSNSILSMYRGDSTPEILDIILSKNDPDGDLDAEFFCGSPPVRTNNPLVRDAQFLNQSPNPSSPLGIISPSKKTNSGKLELSTSPNSCKSNYSTSPKVRIEGFACGSKSVSTLA